MALSSLGFVGLGKGGQNTKPLLLESTNAVRLEAKAEKQGHHPLRSFPLCHTHLALGVEWSKGLLALLFLQPPIGFSLASPH